MRTARGSRGGDSGETGLVSADERDPPTGTARGSALRGRDPIEQHGTPMRVLALDRAGGTHARCAGIDGVPATVETALVGPLEPGAIVLVDAGVALLRLDAEWVP
jgi:hypothetical protein